MATNETVMYGFTSAAKHVKLYLKFASPKSFHVSKCFLPKITSMFQNVSFQKSLPCFELLPSTPNPRVSDLIAATITSVLVTAAQTVIT
jgi:hypothetical protein